ncbi:MAG: sensor histidine kinase [Planctomycetia bacterium]|nr:sensor histidine kinase [Planctomycetia bacterium]
MRLYSLVIVGLAGTLGWTGWASSCAVAGDTPPPAATLDHVVADNHTITPSGKRGTEDVYELPARPGRLLLSFGDAERLGRTPVQLRYRLDGRDDDWRDPDHGLMRFQLRFIDANNQLVDGDESWTKGRSPGWTGQIETSPFQHRSKRITVPPRAAKLMLWLISAGPEETTGVRVFESIRISVVDKDGTPDREIYQSDFETGEDLDNPFGVPKDWERDGTKPGVGRVVRLPGPPARHALALIDEDPSGLGGWITSSAGSPAVTSGDELLVEWSELYAVGEGGAASVAYDDLASGEYRFRISECSHLGVPQGPEYTAVIQVPPPVWARPWFWAASAAGTTGLFALFIRQVSRQRTQRQLAIAEQQRMIAADRMRIAQDLHDDLGANLTRIGMLSDLVRSPAITADESRRYLDQIFENATGLAKHLNEIVWAISPHNDAVEPFSAYLCKYAQDFVASSGGRCRIDLPDRLPDVPLPSNIRHNLFLAAKEALHNAVKHSRAATIVLRLGVVDGRLTIVVEDDGCGIPAAATREASGGKGFANMQRRMQQVGGTFSCESRPGKGTSIRLSVPVSTS